MRLAILLFGMMWFASTAQGQTRSDLCQQQCENGYNLCTNNADELLNQCLSSAQADHQQCSSCVTNHFPGYNCPSCSAPNGCPNGTPSCHTEDCCLAASSSQIEQCNSDHDQAISLCGTDYNNCLNSCGGEVPPAVAGRTSPSRPRKYLSEAAWALLIRNLSRPGNLGVTL